MIRDHPPHGVPRIETNAREQLVLTERFEEIAIYAGLQRMMPRPFIRKCSNEDDRDGLTGDQSIIKLKSGHPRHLHVRNHTRDAAAIGFQKIIGAFERHCGIAQRPNEACQSLPHRVIVVDDRYDGCP